MGRRALLVSVAVVGLALAVGPAGAHAAAHAGTHAEPRVVGVVPLHEIPASFSGSGYRPAQIQRNYDMAPLYQAGLDGKGETIGIVDVYGSPTIKADLASFDSAYHLAPPPSLTVVRPAGPVPKFNRGNPQMTSWATETTLDVEWAHAMAPGARIVLAETGVDEVEGTSGFPEIVKAEKYLIASEHVAVISQSFGATEETFPTKSSLLALRSAFTEANQHHVTVLAATGDSGASGYESDGTTEYPMRVTGWPATDPLVTAVGGTQIVLSSTGVPTAPPRAWQDGGGGVSSVFTRPPWQHGVSTIVGSHRGIPDVAMTASCADPVSVVWSFTGTKTFSPICGTSVATPVFAGIVAIAAELAGHHLGHIDPMLYSLGGRRAGGLVDVTRGNNTVTVSDGGTTKVVVGYQATKGYDLASGWGTADGAKLVAELAGKPVPAPSAAAPPGRAG